MEPGDSMKSPDIDVVSFRKTLLQLREELVRVEQSGAEAAQTVELDQSRVGRVTRMDALQGQAMAKQSQQRRGVQRQRIEAALKRLEEGQFGVCLRCGEEILVKRLEFDPTIFFCIECANWRER